MEDAPPSQARGKHGKLKKLKSKYRDQEEGERQVILQVRHPLPISHVTLNLFCSCWDQAEVQATASSCAPWQKMPRRMLRHRVMQQCARLAVG